MPGELEALNGVSPGDQTRSEARGVSSFLPSRAWEVGTVPLQKSVILGVHCGPCWYAWSKGHGFRGETWGALWAREAHALLFFKKNLRFTEVSPRLVLLFIDGCMHLLFRTCISYLLR